jgi:non-lysosomal glucosylceramidase
MEIFVKVFKIINKTNLSVLLLLLAVSIVFGESTSSMMPPFSYPDLPLNEVMDQLTEGSDGLTPTVKEFKTSWVSSLLDRGGPEIYTSSNSSNFEYIGMPVGGIGAGQVYLGGDGKLWWWDIFNTISEGPDVDAYANPPGRTPDEWHNEIEQGFAIRTTVDGKSITKKLDRDDISDIEFSGQYPIGYVKYNDKDLPVKVELEAFSPFTPLNLADSTYPATILNFTIHNTSDKTVEGQLAGWLENASFLKSRVGRQGSLRNTINTSVNSKILVCDGLEPKPEEVNQQAKPKRKEILFEDFESGDYSGWKVTGSAFTDKPTPNFHNQRMSGLEGKFMADSFRNSGRIEDAFGLDSDTFGPDSDAHTGKLVSKAFRIERRTIKFLIAGGSHSGQTCLNMVVDGKVVRTAVGLDSEALKWTGFDVSSYEGKKAHIEIVDSRKNGWGHVMVDHIVFTDDDPPTADYRSFDQLPDNGSMALALVDISDSAQGYAKVSGTGSLFSSESNSAFQQPFSEGKLVGALGRSFSLAPGEKINVTYVLSWYFPNLRLQEFGERIIGREYASRFESAEAITEHIVYNLDRLTNETRLWKDTWFDSTLPWWFLDRTFLNTSILATNTCYLLDDGRFYAHEGVYHGPAACTHVWGYVQAPGRLFPEIERRLREMVDYNPKIAFDAPSGRIGYRHEFNRSDAVDGQSGVILRTYLEHQMSKDDEFLKRNYANVKKAMNYLTENYDGDRDGILTGGQHNTLDAKWYGKITWLSLHYTAALRATGMMADEMGDFEYAKQVRALADQGRKYIEQSLFNGDYFIQEPDPKHPRSPGVFNGCEYSQLFGQSWAYQVGMGQILDPDKVSTALTSLWKYNFSTDVGPYREKFKIGRWYAMPGEGGMIACTWPKGGSEALGQGNKNFAGYLNECQNGYEYAATSLMMWHGYEHRAIAHLKMMHERYHASKRNPWNEIEWGTHYSRSMASYGLFTAICGFEYHGPKGYIAFSPRITPSDFRAPFTSANGWGTFTQKRKTFLFRDNMQTQSLELAWGTLKVKTLAFDLPDDKTATDVIATVNEQNVQSSHEMRDNRVIITLNETAEIQAGQKITLKIKW